MEVPFGSHPGEMAYAYERDEEQIKEWVEASKTPEGTKAYLDKYVHSLPDHAAYRQRIGPARLAELAAQAGQRRR